MKKTKFISFMLLFTITTIPTFKANATSLPSISRNQAEQRALNMINFTWTYDSNKNTVISSNYTSSVTKPNQFNGIVNEQVKGIPYNWGGQDGLDSSSTGAPWTNFLDAVNRGAYTGNVNTTAGYGLLPGVAGIDCSGFVQSTFNIPGEKLSTYSLFNSYFIKINLNQMKHMDILDRPGDHVLIFDRWGTLNGINGAFTYESTWDQIYGGIQGTKRYFVTIEDINNGYIPGRYTNIVDEDSVSNVTTLGKIINVNYFANIRANPSTAANILGTIPKDAIVKIISASYSWFQVIYNGQTGYVYGNLINSKLTSRYASINNVYLLNIRAGASSSSTILGTLSQNQYAELLGYSTDGNWCNVNVDGVHGWVYSDYIKFVN